MGGGLVAWAEKLGIWIGRHVVTDRVLDRMFETNVGIHYCLEHHGTRNEDEDGRCAWWPEFAHDEEREQPCRFVHLMYLKDERYVFDVVPEPELRCTCVASAGLLAPEIDSRGCAVHDD